MVTDDDGNEDVIRNYNKQATSINQFFPTMLKTRVGKASIYDWFTDEFQDRFEKVIEFTKKGGFSYAAKLAVEQ